MKLDMTPAARKFIGRLLRFDGGPGFGLRLLVTPGGCSGLSAEFSVEGAPKDGEAAMDVDGLTLFLPAQSRLFLDGATIDFVETGLDTRLVFHNAAVQPSCSTS